MIKRTKKKACVFRGKYETNSQHQRFHLVFSDQSRKLLESYDTGGFFLELEAIIHIPAKFLNTSIIGSIQIGGCLGLGNFKIVIF